MREVLEGRSDAVPAALVESVRVAVETGELVGPSDRPARVDARTKVKLAELLIALSART